MTQATLSGVQSAIGTASGLTSIIGGAASLGEQDELATGAGGAGAGLQIAGGALGSAFSFKSGVGAYRRSRRAKKARKEYSSDEMKALASFVAGNQGVSKSALGILSGLGGVISGGFRLAGGKTGLIGSAISGGLSSLIGIAGSVYGGRRQKKTSAQAEQHVDYLVEQLTVGAPEAISFAQDVLNIQATGDELHQMAVGDTEALKVLLGQKMVKW